MLSRRRRRPDPGQPRYVTIVKGNNEVENKSSNTDDEMDFNIVSHQFSHLVGVLLFGVYQIIMIVFLLNTLIAMMNTTFLKIWDTSDVQWKYSKAYYQVEFMDQKSSFPHPLR